MNLSLMEFDIAHQDLNSEEAVTEESILWCNKSQHKTTAISLFTYQLRILKIQSLSSEIFKLVLKRIESIELHYSHFSHGENCPQKYQTIYPRLCNQEFVNRFDLQSLFH